MNNLLTNKSILIADDNTINLDFFCAALNSTNIKIDTASDGLAALGKLQNNNYDIILLDIQMPGMGGLELFKTIKYNNSNINHTTPIVLISAQITQAQQAQMKELGAIHFWLKPIAKQTLINNISRLTNSSSEPKETTNKLDDQSIWNYQAALKTMGNDKEILQQIMHKYMEELLIQQPLVNQLIRINAVNTAKKLVHKLHGSASFCATHNMKQACSNLESELPHQKSNIAMLLEEFNTAAKELIAAHKQPEYSLTSSLD